MEKRWDLGQLTSCDDWVGNMKDCFDIGHESSPCLVIRIPATFAHSEGFMTKEYTLLYQSIRKLHGLDRGL